MKKLENMETFGRRYAVLVYDTERKEEVWSCVHTLEDATTLIENVAVCFRRREARRQLKEGIQE